MLTLLKTLGLAILCLIGLIFIAVLVYVLACIIIEAAKKIKEEVQDNERNGIK